MRKRKAIHWEPVAPAAANAAQYLPKVVNDYFRRGARLVREDSSPAELHRFRLETKRFRYTLEIFRRLYGPALATKLARLRETQQLLGDINDCEVALRMLGAGEPLADATEKIRQVLTARQQAKIDAFMKHWSAHFAGRHQRDAWMRYLRAYAGRRGRRRVPEAEHASATTGG